MSAQTVFLGIIAVATLTMAIMQIAVLVYAVKAVKQAGLAVKEMQRSIEPIIASARQMSEDAARITSLASKQVERVDTIVHGAMGTLKAAMGLVTKFGGAKRPADIGDGDDGLFIG